MRSVAVLPAGVRPAGRVTRTVTPRAITEHALLTTTWNTAVPPGLTSVGPLTPTWTFANGPEAEGVTAGAGGGVTVVGGGVIVVPPVGGGGGGGVTGSGPGGGGGGGGGIGSGFAGATVIVTSAVAVPGTPSKAVYWKVSVPSKPAAGV